MGGKSAKTNGKHRKALGNCITINMIMIMIIIIPASLWQTRGVMDAPTSPARPVQKQRWSESQRNPYASLYTWHLQRSNLFKAGHMTSAFLPSPCPLPPAVPLTRLLSFIPPCCFLPQFTSANPPDSHNLLHGVELLFRSRQSVICSRVSDHQKVHYSVHKNRPLAPIQSQIIPDHIPTSPPQPTSP
jgi:hypothetical protein